MTRLKLLGVTGLVILLVVISILLLQPAAIFQSGSDTAIMVRADAAQPASGRIASDDTDLALHGDESGGTLRSSALHADALAQLLQQLPAELTRLSPAQQQAIAAQLDANFADFLATLDADTERQVAVRSLLEQALTEIALIAAALQSGQLTAAQLTAIADPNHVLNRVSALLLPDELTALEDQMLARARDEFLQVVSPQVDLAAPELTAENRELLLQTLHEARSATDMPFGIGAQLGPGANLDLQQNAVHITTEQLRRSMTPAQFAHAEKFLQEQEKALVAARIVFSPLR